jgi:hypothetical protein
MRTRSKITPLDVPFVSAIETYTGRTVVSFDLALGMFANEFGLKAEMAEGDTLYFVTQGVPPAMVDEEALEEVEFTSWPPQFFHQ